MSQYRRPRVKGGSYFFTVTLADRGNDILVRHIDLLRKAYRIAEERRPFKTIAICVLPDHIHAVWSLPDDDFDFPSRWSLIKSGFSRNFPGARALSSSKLKKREKGIWQRRYWEHAIRNDEDLARHIDYIHYNPVKHGFVPRVTDWPYSSFHRFVERGLLPTDWGGDTRDISGEFGE